MESEKNLEMNEAYERFGEYVIGILLLLKGWEDAAHFHEFPFRVVFIFLAGLFVIVGAKFHDRLAKKFGHFSGVFHIVEGAVEIVAASMLLEKGKQWRPLFLALIGFHYCCLGLAHLLAKENNREKVFRLLRIVQGIVFIFFAAIVGAANALIDPKIEVLLSAAVVAAVGVVFLIKRNVVRPKKPGFAFRIGRKLYENLRLQRAKKNSLPPKK